MRCLIVDDDPSPRDLMKRLVQAKGHRVTTATSCDEALTALAADSFDVAIVDLEMPGRHGAQAIAALRAAAPDMPLLVVSGYDDRTHVLGAIDAGARGYLLKDELSETLPSSLNEVRAGLTPLSPRVAGIVVEQLRRARSQRPQSQPGNAVAKFVPSKD